MVLDNFHSQGILLIWIIVGQGPTMLAVGAGEGCLDVLWPVISSLCSSHWATP